MDDNLHSYRELCSIRNFENHFNYGVNSNNHVKCDILIMEMQQISVLKVLNYPSCNYTDRESATNHANY